MRQKVFANPDLALAGVVADGMTNGGSGLTLIELALDVLLDDVRKTTAAPFALGPTLAGDTQ